MRKYILISTTAAIVIGIGYLIYAWNFIPCSLGRAGCKPTENWAIARWSEDEASRFENIVYPYKNFSEDTINWPEEKMQSELKKDYSSFSPLKISKEKLSENFGGLLDLSEIETLIEMQKYAEKKQPGNAAVPLYGAFLFNNMPFSGKLGGLITNLYRLGDKKMKFNAGKDAVLQEYDKGGAKYLRLDFNYSYTDEVIGEIKEKGVVVGYYDDEGMLVRTLIADNGELPFDSNVLIYLIWTYDGFTPIELKVYNTRLESSQLAITRLKYEYMKYKNALR